MTKAEADRILQAEARWAVQEHKDGLAAVNALAKKFRVDPDLGDAALLIYGSYIAHKAIYAVTKDIVPLTVRHEEIRDDAADQDIVNTHNMGIGGDLIHQAEKSGGDGAFFGAVLRTDSPSSKKHPQQVVMANT